MTTVWEVTLRRQYSGNAANKQRWVWNSRGWTVSKERDVCIVLTISSQNTINYKRTPQSLCGQDTWHTPTCVPNRPHVPPSGVRRKNGNTASGTSRPRHALPESIHEERDQDQNKEDSTKRLAYSCPPCPCLPGPCHKAPTPQPHFRANTPKKLQQGLRYLYTHVHSCIIHNSQEVEATQVSNDGWMDKQNVEYTHNGNLFSLWGKKQTNKKFWHMLQHGWTVKIPR